MRYRFGVVRITPPCFACSQSFLTCRQKMRPRSTISKPPPATIRIVRAGMVGEVAEVLVERAGHREEEVEVDERAGDREEDLLHEIGGERAARTSRSG